MTSYFVSRGDDDRDDRPKADNGYHSEDSPPGKHGCTGGRDNPCDGYPLEGSTRCWFHTAPRVRWKIKQDKRRREVALINAESVFNNEDNADSPINALMQELSRTQAIVRWLGDKLDALAASDPEAFGRLVSQEVEEGTKPLKFRSAVVYNNVLRRQLVKTESGMNPWLVWFLREREHMVRITSLLVALGIKLDQFELSRKQAAMLLDAMHYLALGLGHDPEGIDVAETITAALDAAMADDQGLRHGMMG